MPYMGKTLIIMGLVLLIIGGILMLGGKIGLGKLPGDIFIKRGNFTFFFPIVSSIIISLILTILFNLFRK
ncbi:DUF2905 domain-containing protein [Sporanaerobacter sp. PP17-6a]|jgi:multisubunit Na+/H+ antiporter MnhG subunit|uniref:DUF2905 domain-containing protein n=1 Tax=Sporanaerobacter sp. PP17-6a TaxID=1891289 RepID=UPI0008A042B6|nr:DUF2905 domain-containing protein [Sporanaerobacter sp. PP17-6a]MBE6083335.1 DUF2905 domain-containing protein [Tissierellaceae bacterium]SCL95642.1 hypothetical protein PP176A_2924 [Sporanaerobacter sp. PP17-6a]